MKVNGNTLRTGNVIEHQNRLWRVVNTQHTQPGKGGAYMQVELKELKDGTKLNERFRASETVEKIRLDQTPYQFLYQDTHGYTFMNQENYEQITIGEDVIDQEQVPYLKEGVEVVVETYEESPIGITLPETVTFEVVEADAVVKGQTAASSYKPAILENGLKVSVPPHITTGTKIVVNTTTGKYLERAKD